MSLFLHPTAGQLYDDMQCMRTVLDVYMPPYCAVKWFSLLLNNDEKDFLSNERQRDNDMTTSHLLASSISFIFGSNMKVWVTFFDTNWDS